MGKKSRKTKAKTSDFQKVKLKVGKKRPLPTNVTDVAFKSQAIYIPEQMKNVKINVEDIASAKTAEYKKNIPELLGQVGHFNSNVRVDALTGLRAAFTNDRELIREHLPKVIAKVPRTFADEDQQVRKSSLAFLKCLFSDLTDQEMAPFFDIILSHLYCAMSHIYDDVQRDSLQVVDLCIEYFPRLLTQPIRESLLQHFIELISTKQTNSAAKGSKASAGSTRVLSMKLSNKESSIVWRNRILKRLFDLIDIADEGHGKDDNTDNWNQFLKSHLVDKTLSFSPESGVNVRWDATNVEPILSHFESQKFLLPGFSLRSFAMSSITTLKTSEEDKKSSPWELITTILPLLLDSWHEATADETKQLNIESTTTMKFVLKITNRLLRNYIDSDNDKEEAVVRVRDRYCQDFKKYFFESFPYSYAPCRQRQIAKKRMIAQGGAECLPFDVQSINLSICQLITTLISKEHIGDDAELLATVAEHLSMVLVSSGGVTQPFLDYKSLESCIKTTRSLLKVAMDEATIESLLRPLLVLYLSSFAGSAQKSILLKFFLTLYSDIKEVYITSNPVMTEWLCSLPTCLVEILSSKVTIANENQVGTLCFDEASRQLSLTVISCMRLAILKESPSFTSALYERTGDILNILRNNGSFLFYSALEDPEFEKNVKIYDKCSNFWKRLFEVLLHPSCKMDPENVTALSRVCNQMFVPAECVSYAAELFLRRCKTSQEFTTAMQFVCSLLIGASREYLNALQSSTGSKSAESCEVISSVSSAELVRHSIIVEKISALLQTVNHISSILKRFLCQKILKTYRTLPEKSELAVLKLGVFLSEIEDGEKCTNENSLDGFGKLVSSIVIRCLDSTQSFQPEVIEMLRNAAIDLLQRNENVMRSSILHLRNFELKNHWGSVCEVVQYLAMQTNLHENLNHCHDNINELLQQMKVENEEAESSSLYQSVKLRVSTLFRGVE